jgi:hypothetical protein
MKILMTGMASAHCSIKGNVTFFSGLYKAFSEFADVTICEPRLGWSRADLESFDLVVVGLTPPTSLAANKIYGALHVLDLMYESPKLRLVVDSNQVWQFKNSFASFKRNPAQILSPLHIARKDYNSAVAKHVGSFEALAGKISAVVWPMTYIPLLPWQSVTDAANATGIVPADRAIGIQVDQFFISKQSVAQGIRNDYWAVENPKSLWWQTTSKTIRHEFTPLSTVKKPKDLDVQQVIASSMGLVVPPQDRKVGTWWSYRYLQALNTNTPVVTYWQDTVSFSDSWSKLAYQVEDMDIYDRQELARLQFIDYIDNSPTIHQVTHNLQNDLVESTQERI